MANNVSVTAGTGTTFKTTDTGGVHVPHHNVDTLPALVAGTAVIGKVGLQVGGSDVSSSVQVPVVGSAGITVAPTMGTQTNGAYSANDFVDGKLTLSSVVPVAAGSGLIHRATIVSKSVQTGSFDVVFFNADPTGTTITDNAAVSVADADITKIIGVARCTDVISLGDASVHQATALGLSFKLPSGTTMYAAIITRSAITLASTSDVSLLVNVLPV